MSEPSIDEIKQSITEYVLEDVLWEDERKELPENANLLRILDSLGLMALISYLEERHDIVITNDLLVAQNLESIGALANLVRSRMGVRA